MDRLQKMDVFIRVAELGSFTAAADRLQLPRSTVSEAIQALEKHLQTRLIHRSTRRLHLTTDGESYLDWCRQLLGEIEDTEARYRGPAKQPRGRLRVDMPTRVASRLVAPALPGFLAACPEIELELMASDRQVDLAGEGVDCALRVGTLRDSGLVARPLGQLAQGNFASRAYLATHGEPRVPADLEAHVAVNYILPGSGRVDHWEYVERGRSRVVELRSRVSANNAETYIACAIAGLGLIQIPRYDAQSHVDAGELVEVMPAYRAADLPVNLLYPHRRHLSGRVRVFAEWLEGRLAGIADGGEPALSAADDRSR
ncbi:LysR family transcriptional regulator [Luteimonas sp. RIT-PG2_3]